MAPASIPAAGGLDYELRIGKASYEVVEIGGWTTGMVKVFGCRQAHESLHHFGVTKLSQTAANAATAALARTLAAIAPGRDEITKRAKGLGLKPVPPAIDFEAIY